MENNQEIRRTILALVETLVQLQARGDAANAVLSELMNTPPNRRAAMTVMQVQEKMSLALAHHHHNARGMAMPILENLRDENEPYLENVRVYAQLRSAKIT